MSKHKHVQKRDINPVPAELQQLQQRREEALEEKRALAEHLTIVSEPAAEVQPQPASRPSAYAARPAETAQQSSPRFAAEQVETFEALNDAHDALRQLFELQIQATQAVLDAWSAWMLPPKAKPASL